ncbi:hypothetical protein LTS18_010125 [Coniosporium uncinatum]|uniref:Uncharacterized protein n=1 Tax=Coniosporium uncinatum TaxID=93489 RepID=A0ACC3DWC5_9PEZI|nr:hypothetical protein LTS18_010125 [Coniosporium uncinatum]
MLAWQPMPKPWFARLDWTFDLIPSLRGLNWSWGWFSESSSVQYQHMPSLGTSLARFLFAYLLIDVLKTIMIVDPYFWGFIDSGAPTYLPPSIAHPVLLSTYRALIAFAGIWTAIYFIFTLGPLFLVDILGPAFLGVRGERWMYPAGYGSVTAILDRGLAGFWGTWWHQMFRFVFVSARRWVSDRMGSEWGSPSSKAITIVTAFLLSGIVHAGGTYTLWRAPSPLGPFLFFALQPFGLLLELALQKWSLNKLIRPFSRLLRLIALLSWFRLTFPLLADGLAAGGMRLFEPLLVSLLRGVGLVDGESRWWCWRGPFFSWHIDNKWWRTGVVL